VRIPGERGGGLKKKAHGPPLDDSFKKEGIRAEARGVPLTSAVTLYEKSDLMGGKCAGTGYNTSLNQPKTQSLNAMFSRMLQAAIVWRCTRHFELVV
jgi:hypothetical protein